MASVLPTATLLFALALAFLAAARLYRQNPPGPVLESLRQGRWHFAAVGCALGIILFGGGLSDSAGSLLRGIVSAGLTWIGFRAGLEIDIRAMATHRPWRLAAAGLRVAAVFLLAFGVGMALMPVAGSGLGAGFHAGRAALLCGAFAAAAVPFIPRGTGHPSPDGPALAGPLALVLYGLILPGFAPEFLPRLGPLVIVGYGRGLGITLAFGLILGVMVDFALRAHQEASRGTFVSLGAMATVGGLCLASGLPGIVAGLVAGIWVINTTVRKREALELTDTAGSAVEPLIMILTGAALVDLHARFPGQIETMLVFAPVLLALRAGIRAAAAAALHLIERRAGFPVPTAYALWPPGLVATGLVIQALVEPALYGGPGLPAGAVVAAALSSALPVVRRPAEPS